MKIGLVLSGGGGKGAYELGVWKALKELNLNKYISVFSGTSIGAFNAALFAMDDLEKAEKYHILDCMECGVCSYLCPGKQSPLQNIRIAKQQILENKRRKK